MTDCESSSWPLSLLTHLSFVVKLFQVLGASKRKSSLTDANDRQHEEFSPLTVFYTHTLIRKEQATYSDPQLSAVSSNLDEAATYLILCLVFDNKTVI